MRIFTTLIEVKMNRICEMLGIEFPLIVAPMFLVSNEKMVLAAIESGATAVLPAHNYRSTDELRQAIRSIKAQTSGSFGINLIVNKSNTLLNKQLQVCCEERVTFLITSLGSPEQCIKRAHAAGVRVFCDVVDTSYARKVAALGADAVIAVNCRAGGHAGEAEAKELIPALREVLDIPVISAGGIGKGSQIKEVFSYGAEGVSVGSLFIATEESAVSDEYKQACIDFGQNDIVMSTRLSGTPCTVINTPYIKQTGNDQGKVVRFFQRHKRIKKFIKMFTFLRGMKLLRESAFTNSYRQVWCAGPAIEHVTHVESVANIIARLRSEYGSSLPS